MATLIKHESLPDGELHIPGSLEEMWVDYHQSNLDHIPCPACVYSYRHAFMSAAIGVIDAMDHIGEAGALMLKAGDPKAASDLVKLLSSRLKTDAEIITAEFKGVAEGLIPGPKHLDDE